MGLAPLRTSKRCRPRRNSRVGRGGGNGRFHWLTVMAVAEMLLTAVFAAAAATTANTTRHHPRKQLANQMPRRLMRGPRLLSAARVPAATATSLCCGVGALVVGAGAVSHEPEAHDIRRLVREGPLAALSTPLHVQVCLFVCVCVGWVEWVPQFESGWVATSEWVSE